MTELVSRELASFELMSCEVASFELVSCEVASCVQYINVDCKMSSNSELASRELVICEMVSRELMSCVQYNICLLYTSPSPRDINSSRMPSSA